MFALNDKRVLVTGASGFLGRRLTAVIKERFQKANVLGIGREWDLRSTAARGEMTALWADEQYDVQRWLKEGPPHIVFHLAAKVGGIGGNTAEPYSFFADNMRMGLNIIELCTHWGCRLIFTGTACSYAAFPRMDMSGENIPFSEYDDFFRDLPTRENAPYGVAKRALWTALVAAKEEHGARGFDFAYVVPANLTGPGDHFFADDTKRHAPAAIMDKLHRATLAADPECMLWGSGNPTRDFLYVDDCVEGLIAVGERYDYHRDGHYPINLATGIETKLVSLAQIIAQIVGYRGRIVWNTAFPDGQANRVYDTSRAFRTVGWTASTTLHEGLELAYKDYLARFPK